MCLQNALDCKACPNGPLSAFLAVAIGAALYLIGIVLGNRTVVDKAIATDFNPIQNRDEVRSRTTIPASVSTCLRAASGGAETAAEANSRPGHCFFVLQTAHGALPISSESYASVSVVSGACQYSISNCGSGLAMAIRSL